jgi:diguanylate cyclase (GGDEF)-like protein
VQKFLGGDCTPTSASDKDLMDFRRAALLYRTTASSTMDAAQEATSHSAFWGMLRQVIGLVICVRLAFAAASVWMGLPVLALISGTSAVLCIVARVLLRRRLNLSATLLMLGGVLLHTGTSMILLGSGIGTQAILIAAFFIFLPGFALHQSPWQTAAVVGIVLLSYAGFEVASQLLAPTYPLAPERLATLRWINTVIAFVLGAYAGRFYLRRILLAEQHLGELASTDALTGLVNRRFFLLRAEAEIKRAKRFGGGLAVIVADIDHFKAINDRHGHAAGDEVIRHVAGEMRGALRDGDILCRWGGEEFAVLLRTASTRDALAACERIRSAIEASSCRAESATVQVTMSIGLCSVDPARGLDPALRAADHALYEAKNEGRNRVRRGDLP